MTVKTSAHSPQARELNPHWRDGGDGVPPAGGAAKAVTRPAGVGDGGTSWRLKALRRAQAAAAEQGKDVKEVDHSLGAPLHDRNQ